MREKSTSKIIQVVARIHCTTEDPSFELAISWRPPSVPFRQAFIPQYGFCFYHAIKESLLFYSANTESYIT